MRIFVQIAKDGNFHVAASKLHISQSALSQALSQFEAQLGASLFDRTTRSVRLSALGAHLLPRLERILDDISSTFDHVGELRDLNSGKVAIGCLVSIATRFAPEIMKKVSERHPGIEVALTDGNTAELIRRLANEQIDFAITGGTQLSEDTHFESLFEDKFRLICRDDHPLADRNSVSWSELSLHRFIGFDRETGNRMVIDHALATSGVRLKPQMELAQLGTVIGMVEAGVGIAAVPALACPFTPSVRSIALIHPTITRQVGLLTRAGRSPTFAAATLIKMVRQLLPIAARNQAGHD
jgi:DNA-binding transcriptional LysR family regulator